MRNTKRILVGMTAVVVAVTASCGKKKTDDDTTTNPDGSTKLTAVTDVSQLGVSTALTITLPSAFDQKKTSLTLDDLALTAGKKSQEACQMGEPIRSVESSLSQIAGSFCHFEVEKDKIKFGVKTKITSKGSEFARVWIDNSKAADNQITVYMCQSGALTEKIDITGVKLGADGKPTGMKGSVQNKGGEGTQTWQSSVVFDKGYTGAYLDVTSQDKYTDSSNSGSFARSVAMKLMDASTEVSKISIASKGTWGGSAFAQKGVGLSGNGYGEALFVNSGTNSGQTFSFSRRSYFDKDGYVAAAGATSEFASGGNLYVKTTDIPEYLADSFSPDAPTGWDCGDIAETVDLDPDSTAHKACERSHSEGANCWGSEFDEGSNESI